MIPCRALIDTCSTTNLMTETLAKRLRLPQDRCIVSIGALNALSTIANHTVRANIHSRTSRYQRTLTFLIVPKIASLVPDQTIDRTMLKIPQNVELADSTFHRPSPVDILVGTGTALSILCVGQINLSLPDGPDLFLQKTMLGWVIGGSVPTAQPSRKATCHTTTTLKLDLERFWEIEEGPQSQQLSESESTCEQHFQNTVNRNTEGRYVVALPFNRNKDKLGESKTQALKRLISLEQKFKRDPDLEQEYRRTIQEYLDLGHMSEVHVSHPGYYLPHHGVIKMSSETTKLRVVFDGSAVTSTGISLNDTLHTGPKIQDDLLYILLRFRIHQYVITGDIEKMYRQFLIRPEDRKYQRILWRDTNNCTKTYELNTVTFGLSAAPYLAIRCLKQLAQDEGHRFPSAAKILQRDFYVDDALTGASTIPEALSLRNELTQLLRSAGLNIRQWASNSHELLNGLSDKNINQKLHLGESSTIKTLGIVWDSVEDSITYTVKPLIHGVRVTKRFISSEIAKIYDPLGLLGPIIIVAKILLQKLWTLKVDWDESLPMNLHTEWTQYYTQLPLLNNVTFNRKTIITTASAIELHGFCDASERAYGACVYLRSTNAEGKTHVELLAAKSKVAPLKSQSIPRLELCGALLLSSLINTIHKALHIHIDRTILWTDSTIVLHWLNSSPHTLKTFVANRVSEIQSRTKIGEWHHVSSADNPADLISRGQSIEEFLRPSIWRNGPTWLQQNESCWPNKYLAPVFDDAEKRVATCLAMTTIDTGLLERFSSWSRLLRIVTWCRRWKPGQRTRGTLTAVELAQTKKAVIKQLQGFYFAEEFHLLQQDKHDKITGKLAKLHPFIDQDGILRVGGRLRNSSLSFTQKHPIILPKSHMTDLIIRNEHISHMHAGTQATLYAIRRTYWPIDGRSQVWKTIRSCVCCCRANPPQANYIMGNLPKARVTESRPFTNVGVDYCGPFFIKERAYKNQRRIKVYVAVFICLAVKAVHLELVSDLTSEAFIAALGRFMARRGFCKNLYSDNGSNFIGANNEFKELRELLHSENHHNKIASFLADRSINWHFIPPQAPHFGGLWEAAVKSFKRHLKRVMGAELFTFENLNTLIINIEAILNSRPLTPISSDPDDLLVLTPGHFLIGDALTSLREHELADIPSNRLSGWQRIQQLKQHFWKRWHREYLNELTSRRKWFKGDHQIIENSIVLLREDNVPSMQWPLGRVIKVHPGSDGIIRTVTVRTATSVFDRSIKKLVPLPLQPEDDNQGRTKSTPAGDQPMNVTVNNS